MWTGLVTHELKSLAEQYRKKFNGAWVDGYDEICYDSMTCDEFVGYIKECLATGKEMPEVVP